METAKVSKSVSIGFFDISDQYVALKTKYKLVIINVLHEFYEN